MKRLPKGVRRVEIKDISDLHVGDILKGLYQWTFKGKDTHGYRFETVSQKMWATNDAFLLGFLSGGGRVYRPQPKRERIKTLWLKGMHGGRLLAECKSFTGKEKYTLEVWPSFVCKCSCPSFEFMQLRLRKQLGDAYRVPELSEQEHVCKHLQTFSSILAIEVISHQEAA